MNIILVYMKDLNVWIEIGIHLLVFNESTAQSFINSGNITSANSVLYNEVMNLNIKLQLIHFCRGDENILFFIEQIIWNLKFYKDLVVIHLSNGMPISITREYNKFVYDYTARRGVRWMIRPDLVEGSNTALFLKIVIMITIIVAHFSDHYDSCWSEVSKLNLSTDEKILEIRCLQNHAIQWYFDSMNRDNGLYARIIKIFQMPKPLIDIIYNYTIPEFPNSYGCKLPLFKKRKGEFKLIK